MIFGIMHPGSGLGNQLHRYVATRVLALEKGYDFSIINPDGFKGKSFMDLDMGKQSNLPYHVEPHSGKILVEYRNINRWEEWDKHTYDPDYNFVEDNTIIDGNFEDERYFKDYQYEISQWLDTKWLNIPDDTCMIGFRGGEYYTVPELGLPKEYYERAIEEMKNRDIRKFQVHTDDPVLAKEFFPNYEIIRDIEINWRAMRYVKNTIIANSSFYVLPRFLNGGVTIAPRYFNRYNVKRWDYPQFYYKSFQYI